MKPKAFPKLAKRVFAVRAAWRREMPLRIRVAAVRSAAASTPDREDVPVNQGAGGPPVRRVELAETDSRVA